MRHVSPLSLSYLVPYIFIFMRYRRSKAAANTAHRGNNRDSPSTVTGHRIRAPADRTRGRFVASARTTLETVGIFTETDIF